MKLLRAWLGALPGYLWSGWGAIASLLLGMALWEALAAWYGPLVLPTPLETAQMLLQLMRSDTPSSNRCYGTCNAQARAVQGRLLRPQRQPGRPGKKCYMKSHLSGLVLNVCSTEVSMTLKVSPVRTGILI